MVNVGFVGYRGMVGSVLFDRMVSANDFFPFLNWSFFSTSYHGRREAFGKILNANDVGLLKRCDIIITCQGGEWTKDIYPKLRNSGWNGYWIDSSSALRMDKDSIIALDPVNMKYIIKGINSGIKNFIGGNCTVSLMLMAIHSLLQQDLVEWIISNTYQAASGAGAKNMKELVAQTKFAIADSSISDAALKIDQQIKENIFKKEFPLENIQTPLAFGWIPWIDNDLGNGKSREEWKGSVETNKILDRNTEIPVEGICVRVPTMRCHGQALTIKLKKEVPENEIIELISSSNQWTQIIVNNKQATLHNFHPAKISGTLTIPVGRIRRVKMGKDNLLIAFTVGDQLLWGAAEPLRRVLNIILQEKFF